MATEDVTVGTDDGHKFDPKTVKIKVGDTVKWTWAKPNHSVTSDTNVWPDTGLKNPPHVFSYTFSTKGTYPYYCTLHGGPGGVGMSGKITVD